MAGDRPSPQLNPSLGSEVGALSENRAVAAKLREAADLLQAQGANPFRVGAYRKAADTLSQLSQPVRCVFDEKGREGLEALPGIGRGLASSIAEMLITGRWAQLQRLRGETDPEKLFQVVPGIGPDLARQIHEVLHVETLEALEVASRDGSLENVPGIGPRRAAAICASLTAMLDARRAMRRLRPPLPTPQAPAVPLLLDIDRDYREKAAAGTLPAIAPRRFNPGAEAWLPIMHASRDGWHFTVLYSNTARAHELGRTRDWVVVYFYDGDHAEGQHTIVTEARGTLAGRRVVRGREAECRALYAQLIDHAAA
ncbi:MAG: helix-hairpin-helix domain-containing protein [Burkholderiales bacterium]